jgi:SAM-dependent methyltransferase
VEVYRSLPAGGEAEVVHGAIPERANILELGCGTGRTTHRLIEMGHEVTAVDESPEMLAHVQAAETILSKIEDLRLGRVFDCVLLGSHLINADSEQRRAFLRSCRRHVSASGCVLIERYDPNFDWKDHEGFVRRIGDVTTTLRQVRLRNRRLQAVVEYRVGDKLWLQLFSAVLLGDDEIDRELAKEGLERERSLDERRSWLLARQTIC